MKNTIQSFAITLGFICLCLLPQMEAVSPPPDGGYVGGNTAEGSDALLNLTTGTYNTAVGLFSLRTNTTGSFNTAIGAGALLFNTADQNTANGAGALLNNTTGVNNTALGEAALFSNTTGSFNTGVGDGVLNSNTTGSANTAVALDALNSNTTGSNNTAIGENALNSNTTGSSNTVVGFNSGFAVTTANNVICIGGGVAGANVSNSCFIGNIRGITTQNGDALPVVIDSAGQLGTVSSSRRFKQQITPMDKGSESILALEPVTFHYKSDKTDTAQFGLIAEEVAKVNPDLVARDKNGEIYTVRYDAVNAMLLNEFLKEHHRVEQLEATVANLAATVKEQAVQLQKVSAQIGINKPIAKVVSANP